LASQLMARVFGIEDLCTELETALEKRLANRLEASWTADLGIKKNMAEIRSLTGGKEPADSAKVATLMKDIKKYEKMLADFQKLESDAHKACVEKANDLKFELKIMETMIANYDPAMTKKVKITDAQRIQERTDKKENAEGAVARAKSLIKDVINRN
jgi:hypothetical protein